MPSEKDASISGFIISFWPQNSFLPQKEEDEEKISGWKCLMKTTWLVQKMNEHWSLQSRQLLPSSCSACKVYRRLSLFFFSLAKSTEGFLCLQNLQKAFFASFMSFSKSRKNHDSSLKWQTCHLCFRVIASSKELPLTLGWGLLNL